MTAVSRIRLMVLAAGLALALGACGGKDKASAPTQNETAQNEPPTSEPIAAVSPPAGQKWVGTASETALGGVVIGNPDAPVKLVEYASHTCPHCALFAAEAAAPLRDKYIASGVVSYELRNQIHDPIDLDVAMLARCNGPASFLPLAEQVWNNLPTIVKNADAHAAAINAAAQGPEAQRYLGVANAAGLIDFFAARGLAPDKAKQCLADPAKAAAIVERSDKQSDQLDIPGTPTFFLNGRSIGTHTWETLEPVLQNAGAR